MSNSITRKQLEELMMSLSFNIHTDEDIQFLNKIYNNNQADMYIFRLTNTKKYFESIIIPYCKEHWKEIIKTITNENIKNEFILNFRDEQVQKELNVEMQDKSNSGENINNNEFTSILTKVDSKREMGLTLLNPTLQQQKSTSSQKKVSKCKCLIIIFTIIVIIILIIVFIFIFK